MVPLKGETVAVRQDGNRGHLQPRAPDSVQGRHLGLSKGVRSKVPLVRGWERRGRPGVKVEPASAVYLDPGKAGAWRPQKNTLTRLYKDGNGAADPEGEFTTSGGEGDRGSLVCTSPVSESDHPASLGRLRRKRQVLEELVEAGGVLPVRKRPTGFLPIGRPNDGPGFGVDDQAGDELFEGEPLFSRTVELHGHSLFYPAKPDPPPLPRWVQAGLWTNSEDVCLCGQLGSDQRKQNGSGGP